MADGDFVNKNVCKNATKTPATAATGGALDNIKCSEVVVRATAATKIWDGSADFEVPADAIMSFRGITNSNQLSAHNSGGTGTLYYRTQYYSNSVYAG